MHYFSSYDLWKCNPDWVWADDEREEDPFIEWASDEAARQEEASEPDDWLDLDAAALRCGA